MTEQLSNTYQEFFYLDYYFKQLLDQKLIPKHGMDVQFIYSLVMNGIFPMASYNQITPKLHVERCVISFDFLTFQPNLKSVQKLLFYRKMKHPAQRLLRSQAQGKQYFLRVNDAQDKIIDFTRKRQSCFWITPLYQEFIEKNLALVRGS